ncbi:hypothetical protein FRC15_004862 [Serendipita sp. 397]|nr:hypothetical protein FRC15_004862 [Serendipita sp. 397]KAG8839698.1 hypothetical protein FRC18_008418 [Serendipita sp. 400]
MITVILPSRRSFLKERTIKFCITQAFVSVWLLILVIYFSKGHSFMSSLQSSVFQLLISTNLITLALFLVAAALQVYSAKRQIVYKCSTVVAETVLLCFVICFQTVTAIAFSASVPSFPCTAQKICQESIFFAVVAWIAPLIFVIHAVEFVFRARRLAASDSSVWKTATWSVNWEEATVSSAISVDLEKAIANGPKILVLPTKKAATAATETETEKPGPKSKEKLAQRALARAHSLSKDAYRNMRGKSLLPPALPPKSPSLNKYLVNKGYLATNGEQVIFVVPSKLQYSVPRLTQPPKYFIQIPDNIQYTVPRISKAPCPKIRAKERRKARKAAAAAAATAVTVAQKK